MVQLNIISFLVNLSLLASIKDVQNAKQSFEQNGIKTSTHAVNNGSVQVKPKLFKNFTRMLRNNTTTIKRVCNNTQKRDSDLSSQTQKEIVIGFLLPYTISEKPPTYKSARYYASALTLAIDNITKNHQLLPGYKVTFIWNDTQCLENNTISQQFYQLTLSRPVDAVIGPGCHCLSAAKLGAALNIATISYVS